MAHLEKISTTEAVVRYFRAQIQGGELAAGELDSLVGVYRQLHRRPELSYQEEETASLLAGELRGIWADPLRGSHSRQERES